MLIDIPIDPIPILGGFLLIIVVVIVIIKLAGI